LFLDRAPLLLVGDVEVLRRRPGRDALGPSDAVRLVERLERSALALRGMALDLVRGAVELLEVAGLDGALGLDAEAPDHRLLDLRPGLCSSALRLDLDQRLELVQRL